MIQFGGFTDRLELPSGNAVLPEPLQMGGALAEPKVTILWKMPLLRVEGGGLSLPEG